MEGARSQGGGGARWNGVGGRHLLELSVHHEAVGHAALLRALATVGRAAAARLGGEALAIVRDAHVAVHEDLDVRVGHGRGHVGNVVDGQLAGEDDRPSAQRLGREARAVRVRDRHLRRRV